MAIADADADDDAGARSSYEIFRGGLFPKIKF